MDYIIVIPARLNSSRLPQKMLRPLNNRPLIEWTWRAACKSGARQIIVATDDQTIYDHLTSIGATTLMTDNNHESGTDRLSEVVQKLQFHPSDIIVNWQGDEPFLTTNFIEYVVESLQNNPSVAMSTLATPIYDWSEVQDPNIVKVVLNEADEALYFSRAPIPYCRNEMKTSGTIVNQTPYLRHIGLYAYRAAFLCEYPHLVPSPLESLEKLEQLRALANNYKIAVATSLTSPPPGIDTEEDLERAIKWLAENQASII